MSTLNKGKGGALTALCDLHIQHIQASDILGTFSFRKRWLTRNETVKFNTEFLWLCLKNCYYFASRPFSVLS